ncbi:MAG: Ig-like domain repeat protein [Nocardioides sp.]
MFVHSNGRRLGWSAVALVVIGTGLQLAAPSAHAALASPEDLGPLGDVATNSPVFSWSTVPGAAKYEIQADDAADYSSPAFTVTTTNRRYVPTVLLAGGTQHWRVRALDADATPSSWTTGEFTISPVAPPTPQGPADGTSLHQPASPPLLEWTETPGAVEYTVQLDKETDFVDAVTYTTRVTSLVVPDPLEATTYHWRVKAKKTTGIESAYSEPISFSVGALAPVTIVGPDDDPDNEVEDVVLDWEPVPGAQYYQLRVATDEDFNTIIDNQTKILGTRYSPPVTYLNNQYYWQVRAVDLSGNPTAWSSIQANFNRVWPDRPQARYPAGPGTVEIAGQPYFQWTPVQHATYYQLDVGGDPNFSPGSFDTCRTAGTTYTTQNGILTTRFGQSADETCSMQPGAVMYWRVRGMDLPKGVQGLYSATQAFRYRPSEFRNVRPANGQTVDVPTFSWESVRPAERYEIAVYDRVGGQVLEASTYSTSYTPVGVLALEPDDGPFTWQLNSVSADGTSSVIEGRTFRVSGGSPATGAAAMTPLSGRSSDPATMRAPSLRWEPSPDAASYRLYLGNAGSGVYWTSNGDDVLGEDLPYPAVTDISTRTFAPGTYDWFAVAYAEDGSLLDIGPVATFRVADFPTVTGQALALDGLSHDAGTTCTAHLNADGVTGPRCDAVPASPEFSWDHQADMALYMVYLSEDASFTNLVERDVPVTAGTRYALTLTNDHPALPESKAGQAYYWTVRPCKALTVCAPDPVSSTGMATNAFRKESPAVTSHPVTTEVVDGAGRATSTEVTFDWDDYFDTNQAHVWSATGERGPQAARTYRIQVSGSPTFSSTASQNIDDKVVDQSTYTAVQDLYPEGTLYWRVQAIDGDENALTWSPTRSFVKQSPQVTLTGPANQSDGSGAQQLTWAPQAFASSYELAVSKDGDANFSDATKLFANKTVKQVGYVWDSPIPVSNLPYHWRVRRKDAAGNVGPWSAARSFTVRGLAPSPLSPAAGAFESGNGPLFTWDRVDEAATYVLEVRVAGSATNWATITTPATSWATVKEMPAGSWQWRVTARNTASTPKNLGTSDWRDLSVVTGPTATTAPVVTGSGKVGTPLNASEPVWDLPGVTNTWQWKRGGVAVAGATGQSYVVTAEDVGRPISVTVTGTAVGFQPGTSTSNATVATAAPAPTATSPASISGTGKVGDTLSSTLPTWSLADVVSTRQWLRNDTPIAGATDATYAVRPTDVGATITLRVTGTRDGHEPGSSLSNGVVGVRGDAPEATTPPSLSGSGKVGTSLQASPPTWSTTGVSNSVQWLRDGTPISGATGSAYSVGTVDVDHEITARYTGTASGRAPATVISNAVVGQLGDAPTASSSPILSGAGKVGGSLSVPLASWNTAGVTESLQWLRDGSPIAGQTSRTHVVTADDLGSQLSVLVTGTAVGRRPGTVSSSSVLAVFGDAPVATRAPAVAGTTSVGRVLTADPGTWTGDPTFTFTWLRNGNPIAGATGTTYQVVAQDAGQRVAVRLSASAPGRTPGTATSPTVAIYRLAATVSITPGTQRVRLNRRAPIKVTLTVPGLPGPTGTIRIYDGSRLLKTLTVRADQRGVVRTKLEMTRTGKRKITAKYSGSSGVMPKAGTAKVTVVR